MLFLYRLCFPIVFLFFIPGLIWKLIRRSGWKKTYMERFGIFSRERKAELSNWRGAIWIHAVSVGETNVALTLLKAWNKVNPDHRYILSTTTTTGQEIARNKAPDNVKVIFCPIDSYFAVNSTMSLLKPAGVVIMETELWPNLIMTARKRNMKIALINTRISDRSVRGYLRFRFFFAPILMAFDRICVQTNIDCERIHQIAPKIADTVSVCGNIKFDQAPPAGDGFDYESVFGKRTTVFLSCSTHSPEEKLHLDAYKTVHSKFPETSLCIVPRHAERGAEIEKQILDAGFTCFRRSTKQGTEHPDVLLADTTGELPGFIKGADVVLMGKTMAGQNEGQNIIEPAVMGKPVICGPKLKNFRQALDLLVRGNAVLRLENDEQLADAMCSLADSAEKRFELGERARTAMMENKGALQNNVRTLEELFR